MLRVPWELIETMLCCGCLLKVKDARKHEELEVCQQVSALGYKDPWYIRSAATAPAQEAPSSLTPSPRPVSGSRVV